MVEPVEHTLSDLLPTDMEGREHIIERYGKHENPTVELARGLVNAEKQIGAPRAPNESSTDEQRATFWSALGRPESHEGYQVEIEDADLKKAIEGSREALHQANVTSDQFAAMSSALEAQNKALANAKSDRLKELQGEWEKENREKYGEKYEERRAMVARGVQELEGVGAVLTELGLPAQPILEKLLYEMADKMGDSPLPGHTPKPHDKSVSTDEARMRMRELLDDPEFQSDKKHTRQYKEKKAEYDRLAGVLAEAQG